MPVLIKAPLDKSPGIDIPVTHSLQEAISLPDDYIEHGNVEVLKEETGISASIILKKVIAAALGQNPER